MPRIRNGRENLKQKRNRVIAFADVDKELFNWVVNTASGLPGLSGQILLEKARKIATDLQYDNTEIDINWINRFKARHCAVNIEGLNGWKAYVIPSILKNYKLEKVFTVDETALFWKLLPNYTHVVKGQKFAGGKLSKKRVSIFQFWLEHRLLGKSYCFWQLANFKSRVVSKKAPHQLNTWPTKKHG